MQATFSAGCEFTQNSFTFFGQQLQKIEWGTVLGPCYDCVVSLIDALEPYAEEHGIDSYTYASISQFLSEQIKVPLSLCFLDIRTDQNYLSINFQNKTLTYVLLLYDDAQYQYQLNLDKPTPCAWMYPAETLVDVIPIALLLLKATTPEEVARWQQKVELFYDPGLLIPVETT